MNFTRTAACAFAAALISVANMASALTVDNVSGAWFDAAPQGAITGNGSSQLRWGTPFRQPNQSGYNFTGSSDTPFEVEANEQFVIGEFEHLNFAVTGDALQSADLVVSLTFANAPTVDTVFSFTHDETRNSADNCPYGGGTNGVGLNAEGCADRVSVSLDVDASKSVMIDGSEFFLDFEAFRFNGARESSFVTAENANNRALILGSFRAADAATTVSGPAPIPAPVPLPASFPLMALGLGAIGVLARRRRK